MHKITLSQITLSEMSIESTSVTTLRASVPATQAACVALQKERIIEKIEKANKELLKMKHGSDDDESTKKWKEEIAKWETLNGKLAKYT